MERNAPFSYLSVLVMLIHGHQVAQSIAQRAVAKNHEIPGSDKSLARPTSRCILFDGESISFDASLVLYIYIYIYIYVYIYIYI